MLTRPFLKIALIAATIPLLGGCVAALVPLAAGGAIVGKDRIGKKSPKRTTPSPTATENVDQVAGNQQTAQDAPEVAQIPTEPISAPIANENPLPVELAAVTRPPSPALIAEPAARMGTTDTQQPEIDKPAAQKLPLGPLDFRSYDVLYRYVDQQSRRDPLESQRLSAILAAPETLSPMRTDCSIRPPAVLIDLDPTNATFDPVITPRANPALTQMLASLRLQAIDVFWISEMPAVKAGALRRALIDSEMDPLGSDSLLLMRNSEDRKQARRKEVGETHCLLAIAGDQRADFDELYSYLKDPSAAQSLEELIGAGWFLTPLPLSEG